MNDTNISFYLKIYRIHVFVDTLRGIGCPRRICFMISDDGNSLLISPYPKKDLKSHSIPSKTYTYRGEGGVDISSYKLCYLIARMQNWATERSYRIPGTVYEDKRIAIFDLRRAEIIERERTTSPFLRYSDK